MHRLQVFRRNLLAKPNFLSHFLSQQAEKKDKELLGFTKELKHLEEASKLSMEQINGDFSSLEAKVASMIEQVENSDQVVKDQLQEFLEVSVQKVHSRDINKICF